jgi:hypothetical protein
LQPTLSHGDHVERNPQAAGFGMAHEPALSRQAEPTLLLLVHHLERIAKVVACLLLDLAEDQPPAATCDHIQLVTARPDIPRQDAVAAQAVPPDGALLRAQTRTWHSFRLRAGSSRDRYGLRTAVRTRNFSTSMTASGRPPE